MARRPAQAEPLHAARLSEAELRVGIARLNKRVVALEGFDPNTVQNQFDDPGIEALKASIADALDRTFGNNTVERRRYRNAAEFDTGPINMYQDTSIQEVRHAVKASRDRNLALLKQAVSSLEEQLEELGTDAGDRAGNNDEVARSPSRKIFVVHGHDDGARETVARFIERIGFEAIILHEQANRGRTVIEKVEAHGDVGFAVVLLTPDDVGGQSAEALNQRARQNVILELGYFIGLLTRERVCALRKGDVEIPSDFAGVVYQTFDEGGGWKTALARELQDVGYDVDWNKVMR
ncbi:nucleotide-binding protein [Sphingobium sp. Cam5-1]|nr:nucleotide-binding protein [Sphingobium sp. Cam5-1]